MPTCPQDYVVTPNHDNDDMAIDETNMNFCLLIDCNLVFYKDAVTTE